MLINIINCFIKLSKTQFKYTLIFLNDSSDSLFYKEKKNGFWCISMYITVGYISFSVLWIYQSQNSYAFLWGCVHSEYDYALDYLI